MVDKRPRQPDELALRQAWIPLSHRLAVAAGSLAALLSLFRHVPLVSASLRGGAAYVAVLVAARLGLLAMQKAVALDVASMEKKKVSGE